MKTNSCLLKLLHFYTEKTVDLIQKILSINLIHVKTQCGKQIHLHIYRHKFAHIDYLHSDFTIPINIDTLSFATKYAASRQNYRMN